MSNFLRQVFALTYKDLLVEWRSPGRVIGLFFFALALLLMIAFTTGASVTLLRKQAGGALWIGLLLASTRSLDLSFSTETESGALEGLVLWPIHPMAIYFGKGLANTLMLLIVAIPLTPLTIAIYDAPIHGDLRLFAGFLFLGSAALAAPGTLYGLMTAQARGASVLLPVLLFPLVIPTLICAARGTSVLMEKPGSLLMLEAPSWLALLFAINAVHWGLSGFAFGQVVEET